MKKILQNTNTSKDSLKHFIFISATIQILLFVLLLIIQNFFTYNIDNYRYIYSSLLQIIGGIFAFIASSTLVAYQFLTSFSPMSIVYYPKRLFISFLIINLTIIGFDILAICVLQNEINFIFRCVYDFLITLNIYPLALAFKYVLFVIKSISPQGQLKRLIQRAEKAETNDQRLDVLYSLEELCLSAIHNGQGGFIRLCQHKLQEIITLYSTTHIELNKNSMHYPDNPLRIIPDIIERISYSMFDNNMQNLVHYNGHILRELSGSRYDKKTIASIEIASAIKNIGIYGIEKRKGTDIYNFIANAVYCIDESNSASTMFLGCKYLLSSCENYIESYSRETLKIIEEIYDSIDRAIKNKKLKPKNSVLMIDFLLNQTWLNPYYEKYDIKTIPTIIENFNNIRNDLYELSKNPNNYSQQ